MLKLLFAAGLGIFISCSVAQADVNDQPLLDLLGKIEGPEGYSGVSHSARVAPPKDLTRMSIEEVLDYQRHLRQLGSRSSAVGKYQFIYKTLDAVVDEFNIDTSQKFNRRTQDFLARRMLEKCDFYDPDASHARIGNCLARTWAAIPVVSGSRKGRSYYHGTAGNKALTSPKIVLSMISKRFDDPVYEKASAGDLQDAPFATPIPLSTQQDDGSADVLLASAEPQDNAKIWSSTFKNTDAFAVPVPLQ